VNTSVACWSSDTRSEPSDSTPTTSDDSGLNAGSELTQRSVPPLPSTGHHRPTVCRITLTKLSSKLYDSGQIVVEFKNSDLQPKFSSNMLLESADVTNLTVPENTDVSALLCRNTSNHSPLCYSIFISSRVYYSLCQFVFTRDSCTGRYC